MKRETVLKAENILAIRHQKINENYEKNREVLNKNEEYLKLNSALVQETIENARREVYGEKVDRKKKTN